MERERHPLLFTLCGFVLCVMFAGNLAKAQEPQRMSFNTVEMGKYKVCKRF